MPDFRNRSGETEPYRRRVCGTVDGDPGLVRLTPDVVTQVEAFLVIPPDHRNTVRVRLVMDAVAALFERERVVLAGCWREGFHPRQRATEPEDANQR